MRSTRTTKRKTEVQTASLNAFSSLTGSAFSLSAAERVQLCFQRGSLRDSCSHGTSTDAAADLSAEGAAALSSASFSLPSSSASACACSSAGLSEWACRARVTSKLKLMDIVSALESLKTVIHVLLGPDVGRPHRDDGAHTEGREVAFEGQFD